MHLVTPLLFLTLVVFANSSFATTTEPSPDFRDKPKAEQDMEVDQTKVQLVTPTIPPPLSEADLRRSGPYFYRYRNDFSLSGGPMWGDDLDDFVGPHWQGGIQHQLSDSKLRAWELAGEIVSNETGLLSFSRRWNHSRSRIRPYHKVGLSVLIDPSMHFATVLHIKHYLLRAGAGLEYSIGGSFSLRLEALGLAGVQIQQIGTNLATVWAF
jgi:hypothetical protein